LDRRASAAGDLPVGQLLLRRLCGAGPAAAPTWAPLGALWARPGVGERHHRARRGRGLRRLPV